MNKRVDQEAPPSPNDELLKEAPGEYTDWEKRVWRRGVEHGSKLSMDAAFKIREAEDARDRARHIVSKAINVLLNVKVAIEDDDTDEAIRLINEATES